ncbi:MAG: peptidylprolyl isomerase [Hydrococcus sp. SU_1_0]|nr:peptidylprolyl isomerase [Hydrococcus sp. SU_1_0]
MTLAIQSKAETITTWDIIPRLARYQMLPQLIKESIIDEAIESIECTPEEITKACQIFEQQNRIQTASQRQAWASSHGITQADIKEIATRKLKIEKLKIERWENAVECYFLKRKAQLDKVSFSIIRLADQDLAQEIFFRIQNQEQSFAELAKQYSESAEAHLGGMVAPIELGMLSPAIAKLLQNCQPGELLHPIPINGAIAIIQINTVIPATLDPLTRQRLLNEQFSNMVAKANQRKRYCD